MGKLTRVLEKSGYTVDLSRFEEDEVVFELVEETTVPVSVHEALYEEQFLCSRKKGTAFSRGNHCEKGTRKIMGLPEELLDSFLRLREKILTPKRGEKIPRSILITSVLPREGKSFIATNLGITLAQGTGYTSLLLDCDLRHPSLAQLFGMENLSGLADYLIDERELADLIRATTITGMSVLTSGIPHLKPEELLASVRMHDLVEELTGQDEDRFVVIDTPCLQHAPESIILSHAVDGVVLVVQSGRSSKAMIEQAVADIGADKILGIIFNGY